MTGLNHTPTINVAPKLVHRSSLVISLVNRVFHSTGDEDLGEEGDNGEADDADLDDDWGLDNE